MAEVGITFTLAEFLHWEQPHALRHEFVGGRVYAMTGGSERHALMAGYLFELVAPGARGKGCRPFADGRHVMVNNQDLYSPDVMVVCGKAGNDLYEVDATLIVEILSPSTRSTDKREKLRAYRDLPALQQFVLVEPDLRHIEVVTWPEGEPKWATLGPDDLLLTAYGAWPVADIYDVVDRASGRDTRN